MNKAFKPTDTQQAIARQEEEIPQIKNSDIDFYRNYLKKYRKTTILVYNIDTLSYGEITQNGFTAFGGSTPPPPVPVKNYQGTWNASTNTPIIPSATTGPTGNADYYYYVDVAGNTNIDGTTIWEVGDIIMSIGTRWIKVGSQVQSIVYKTEIETTAIIPVSTPILTNASSPGMSKTLQNTFLGTNPTIFQNNNAIRIIRNGQELSKSGVNYINGVSFSLPTPLAIGETLQIYSDLTI